MPSIKTIETMLISLLTPLDPLLTDVERLRKTVEPQRGRRDCLCSALATRVGRFGTRLLTALPLSR
jgi:hypothetical protein